MSKASELRHARQLKKRVGKSASPHILAIVVESEFVTIHYRSGALRAPRDAYKPNLESLILSTGRFIKSLDGVFLNPKARLLDLCLIGTPTLTMVPV
jgi:hypothetical protein